MVTYGKLLFKQVLFRRPIWIAFGLMCLIVTSLLLLNMQQQNDLQQSFQEQISFYQNTIETLKNENLALDKSSERYQLNQLNIQIDETMIQQYIEFLDKYVRLPHYYSSEWDEFYRLYQNHLEAEMNYLIDMQEPEFEDFINSATSQIKQRIDYLNYLHQNQLIYENSNYPIFGMSFYNWVSQWILPTVFVFVVLFMLSQLYLVHVKDAIDFGSILPFSKVQKILVDIMIGYGSVIVLFLLISLFTIGIAGFAGGNFGFKHPIYLAQTSQYVKPFIPTLQGLLLAKIYLLNLVLFVYLLRLFIKKETVLFLLSMCIVLGLPNFARFFEPLKQVAGWHFFTSIEYVNLVNGSMSQFYNNGSLVWLSQIIVQCGSLIGLIVLLIISKKLAE